LNYQLCTFMEYKPHELSPTDVDNIRSLDKTELHKYRETEVKSVQQNTTQYTCTSTYV